MNSRARLVLLAAILSLHAHGLVRGEGALVTRARESIAVPDLRKHVELLADDQYEGREGGSRGGRAIGHYLVKELEKLGVKGAGDGGGYFQEFQGIHRNVLAILPGSDEQLAKEVIVVGAHYDHVGYGNSQNSFGPIGKIHNGADDNASGTAGLLELIEAFQKAPALARRTILFAFWDAEEKGLYGSKHWVEHPTLPLQRVVLQINADMIGRLRKERIEILGTRSAAGLRRIAAEANETADLSIDFNWEMTDNSDHYSFYSRGIPSLMVFTGLHQDYHRPSDDIERVNFEGMQRVGRLMFDLVRVACDEPRLPSFRRESKQDTPEAQKRIEVALPPPPGRLGVQWDAEDRAAPGLKVIRVTRGSAADRGGMRVGDRIVSFNGQELVSGADLRRVVLTAPPEVEVKVVRTTEAQERTLKLRLPGEPIRLGISWREDSAEPGTVIVTRVTPGSPADEADILAGDRIDQIAGEPFKNGAEFQRRVASVQGEFEFRRERNGRITNMTGTLPAP